MERLQMRKSVKQNDSGYDCNAQRYKILLDGKILLDCFTADEEKKEAWVYKKDKEGHYIIKDGELEKECLYGKVEIVEAWRPITMEGI